MSGGRPVVPRLATASGTVAAVPSAVPLLAQTRAAWRRANLLRATVSAATLLIGTGAALVLVDLVVALPAAARVFLRALPLAAAVIPIMLALRRSFPGPDDRRIALLMQERLPGLENMVATALEAADDSAVARAFRASAERRLSQAVGTRPPVPLRLRRPIAALGLCAVAMAVILGSAPGSAGDIWLRWSHPVDALPTRSAQSDRAEAVPVEPIVDPRFGEIALTIAPPAYTGLPVRAWSGEGAVGALSGSAIRVAGPLPAGAETVRARLIGGEKPPVRHDGGRWSVDWVLSAGERGLSVEALAAGVVVARRVFPIAQLQDQAPQVELNTPAEDMVVARPRGEVVIRASARDDYGVGEFQLAWIRSRGSGESFAFEEGAWEWARVQRSRRAGGVAGSAAAMVGEYVLDLAAAGLEPGDVLHLRAVARDRNDVTGPGTGVSQTRVIRIARPGEMAEATTLIGFPIEVEQEPMLSQRMIILLTERLRDRAPELGREDLLAESQRIADEQARLRSRVGDQIFTRATGAMQTPDAGIGFEETVGAGGGHVHAGEEPPAGAGAQTLEERVLAAAARATGGGTLEEIRHDHDGDPIIAVSQPLLGAYNAMWAAERELRQGAPASALPHQYEALRVLQEIRQAGRVYLRGRQSVAPVNVAAARGTGELDDAAPAPRSPGEPAPSAVDRVEELEAAAAWLPRLPRREAALALSALAVRVLADPAADPHAATLLTRAADAARAGEPDRAAALVLRARAVLAPGSEAGKAPPVPAAADPISARYFRLLGGARP